jgi:hypothetical protein
MSVRLNKTPVIVTEMGQLSKHDIGLMLVMCTDLVNLCAKLTAKIDPAAAAMLAYVRDDIVIENKGELDKARIASLILGNGHASVRERRRPKARLVKA